MKTFILILLFSLPSFAVTKATFFGMNAMIQILPQINNGPIDSDSLEIYKAMNVPPKDSVIGPGKGIVSSDRGFNLACGIRSKINYECSLVLSRASTVQMDPIRKMATFEATGDMADELRQQFFLTPDEFHFKSTDEVFSIDAVPGHFVMKYSAEGL